MHLSEAISTLICRKTLIQAILTSTINAEVWHLDRPNARRNVDDDALWPLASCMRTRFLLEHSSNDHLGHLSHRNDVGVDHPHIDSVGVVCESLRNGMHRAHIVHQNVHWTIQ